MRFPALETWVRVKKYPDGTFHLVDYMFDDDYVISKAVASFVRRLDGKTDPYSIDSSLSRAVIDKLLRELDDECLLRKSRIAAKWLGSIYVTLFRIRTTSKKRLFAYISNALLQLSWLPVLLVGCFRFPDSMYRLTGDHLWLGILIGALAGIFLHEAAHTAAAMGYGARVFEMGVMISRLLPGAYVFMDTDNVKRRLRRAQIDLAGIEMNLFLCGLFLILSTVVMNWIDCFFMAGAANLVLAATNLLLSGNVDGLNAMSELLGDKEILDRFRSALRDPKKRRQFRKQGALGYAKLACGCVLLTMQLALPLLMILNMIEVFL